MGYENTRSYSNDILQNMIQALAGLDLGDDLCVGTAGSFARREASAQSDLDFFFLHESESTEDISAVGERVSHALIGYVAKPPSLDGAFNKAESIADMLKNIGGQDDDNAKMTRRILLLLEGEWLYNEKSFLDIRTKLLERYLAGASERSQIALFLLNDIIRYYRTICVDYEHKTFEDGKP